MKRQNNKIIVPVFAAVMIFSVGCPASAQPKPAPPLRIPGCTTYLQLMEAQHAALERDEAMLAYFKEKRAAQASSAPQATNPVAGEKPVAIDYDVEIGKLAFMMDNGRKFMTSLDTAYHMCIKTPPAPAKTPARRGR